MESVKIAEYFCRLSGTGKDVQISNCAHAHNEKKNRSKIRAELGSSMIRVSDRIGATLGAQNLSPEGSRAPRGPVGVVCFPRCQGASLGRWRRDAERRGECLVPCSSPPKFIPGTVHPTPYTSLLWRSADRPTSLRDPARLH